MVERYRSIGLVTYTHLKDKSAYELAEELTGTLRETTPRHHLNSHQKTCVKHMQCYLKYSVQN